MRLLLLLLLLPLSSSPGDHAAGDQANATGAVLLHWRGACGGYVEALRTRHGPLHTLHQPYQVRACKPFLSCDMWHCVFMPMSLLCCDLVVGAVTALTPTVDHYTSPVRCALLHTSCNVMVVVCCGGLQCSRCVCRPVSVAALSVAECCA
jgi:hypothetical protein